MRTKVPDVQDALLALITSSLGSYVTAGLAWEPQFGVVGTPGVRVAILDANVPSWKREPTQTYSGTPDFTEREAMETSIYLAGSFTDADVKTVRDAMFDAFSVLEAALLDNVMLGGLVQSCFIAGGQFATYVVETGEGHVRRGEIRVDIKCTQAIGGRAGLTS